MRTLAAAALLALFAAPSYAQSKMQAGFSLGPTWAMSGSSFILDYLNPTDPPNKFKDDFEARGAADEAKRAIAVPKIPEASPHP